MRKLVVLTLATCAAIAHGGEIEVVNSGFEDVRDGQAVGWSKAEGWAAVRGEGLNGGGGLVWTGDGTGKASGSAQRIAGRPEVGKRYRIRASFRVSNWKSPRNRGNGVWLELYNAQGKWVSGCLATGPSEANSDWVQAEAITKDVTPDIAALKVMPWVAKGSSGTFVVDNVSVEPYDRPTVAFVTSDAYRDMGDLGWVKFSAALFPTKAKAEGRRLSAVFAWTDAFGEKRRTPATGLTDESATLDLSIRELALGESDVVCELLADGQPIGAGTNRFTRFEAWTMPTRKVSLDRFGRCLVNGKPFFPLGLYCGRVSPRKVEILADSPFNCVMPYGSDDRQHLDMLAKGNIWGLITVRHAIPKTRWARERKFETAEEIFAYLEKKVLPTFKDAPNLLGWYVCDECPVSEVPARENLYRFLKKADPDHPTWSVLDRTWDLREFTQTYDVLGIDPYPVGKGRGKIRRITDMCRVARGATLGSRPMWNVPQTFNWNRKPGDRYPSYEELRSIFWQHIACGATGLIGYKFESAFAPEYSEYVKEKKRDELMRTDAPNWLNVCRVAAEVATMTNVILSVEAAPKVMVDHEAVACRAWVCHGDLYVLVTNPLREPLAFGVTVAEGDWEVASTPVGVAPASSTDRTLAFSLPPLGVSFVRLVKRQDDLGETAKWQAAIDAAAARGGGRVTVPAGRHRVGQLHLKSNVELHLEKGAVLEGIFGWNAYPPLELPNSEGVWRAIVFANGVTNVAVTGEGTIFGDGSRWPGAPAGYKGCQEGARARGMFFTACRGVRLEDFTLRDSACWGIVFKLCDGVTARRVKIDNHGNRNNDGFDIEAKNVLIEDCDIDAGDDAVCIKSNTPDYTVENVTVRGCVARSQCNCYKIGTASHGIIRNVRFERCRTEAPRRDYFFFRGEHAGKPGSFWKGVTEECPFGMASSALSVECVDGGWVEDISFSDIEIDGGVMSPIFVRGGTRPRRKCGIPPNRYHILRNIVFENVRGRASGVRASSITGVDGCRVRNVTLKNVHLTSPGAGAEESERAWRTKDKVPYRPEDYPDANGSFGSHILPAFGLYIDRADGIKMEDVSFTLAEGAKDVRPPIYRTASSDAAAVSARLSEQLLSTDPAKYEPQGYRGEKTYDRQGRWIHYSVASLWANALACARLSGDKSLERRLVAAFEPFYGPRRDKLKEFRHVDWAIQGAIPLEIARLTGDPRARKLGLDYADKQWRQPKTGDPRPPRDETSFEEKVGWWEKGYSPQTRLWMDDMYMISFLQVQAYLVSGDRRYLDRTAREMCLYLDRLQLPNGLFHHARDAPFVWGRGAGWMAAAMPTVLKYLEPDSPFRTRILEGYRKMMTALLRLQRPNGLWGQLVDDAESWDETSGSAMFAYGMMEGAKHGWLDGADYGAAARKTYEKLVSMLDEYGNLPDVCIGTGASAKREDYLSRPRIHGDPHGQAPLMWLCRSLLEREDVRPAEPKMEPVSFKQDAERNEFRLLNRPTDGFRGLWYMNQYSNDEFVYKYSGGMGVYCAGHIPMAVYSAETDRTYFCYGGTDPANKSLIHCVSYFDHKTHLLARPIEVLDKRTVDAHDNPVLSLDDRGYVWMFSSSHGINRPSCILRSVRPHDISEFKIVKTGNFSYPQPHFMPGKGFLFIETIYRNYHRTNSFSLSDPTGENWTEPQTLALINTGDYQRSWRAPSGKIGIVFDQHPVGKAYNGRTDVFYMETSDGGKTWRTAAGEPLKLPIVERGNPTLVFRYAERNLNVYLKGVRFDAQERPYLLYVVSTGYESGPKNDPRRWMVAHWDGQSWVERDTGVRSDSNYDFGVLTVESPTDWTLLAATGRGPQPWNPGGEIQCWKTTDAGRTWTKRKDLTSFSPRNQNYPRTPLGAQDGFWAMWADGDGRQVSESHLYFCDRALNVWKMPRRFDGPFAKPVPYEPGDGVARAEKTADGVRLVRRGRTIWAFSTADGKPSVHPLSFPDGNAITASRDADHPWHRGLWFSWKYLNGVNFWETDAYGESEGEQRIAACDIRTQGGGATVRMDVQWGPRNEPSRVFLDERREIVFSEPDKDGVYEIRWKARFTARETTVVERTPPRTLADGRRRGGYAGLSLRLADFAKTFDCETDGRHSVSYRSPQSGQVVRLRIVRAPETSFCYHWEDNRFTSLSPVFDEPLTLASGETLELEYIVSVDRSSK